MIFTVTASVVPAKRVTVAALLSLLALLTVSAVILSVMLPLMALMGILMSEGEQVGTTTLNWFSPTFSSVTLIGSGSIAFRPNRSVVKDVSPPKMSSGRLLRLFLKRFRLVNPDMPEKSPVFNSVIPFERRSNDVIVAS